VATPWRWKEHSERLLPSPTFPSLASEGRWCPELGRVEAIRARATRGEVERREGRLRLPVDQGEGEVRAALASRWSRMNMKRERRPPVEKEAGDGISVVSRLKQTASFSQARIEARWWRLA